jgi:hypothetical protein
MNTEHINEKIKEAVLHDKTVTFSYYRAGNLYYLYYKTENGIEFPVPISDTGEATFKATDRALYFMRWIRSHMASLEENKS